MVATKERLKASPASQGIELREVDNAGGVAPLGGSVAAGAEASKAAQHAEASESALSSGLQILFPFLFAGLGMVAAGLLLGRVMHREVFRQLRELCILVPPLLGLKGNLEMTLASRLSSHAALGDLDSWASGAPLVAANLALIQCQGLVLGFLASVVAAVMSHTGGVSYDHFLLLASSAMSTASLASLLIGLLMVAVVVLARRCGCNPDNVAAPVAAALGDLVTLALLANAAEVFWRYQGSGLSSFLIAGYFLVAVLCACLVLRNPHTARVLYTGWGPVICSLCISSVGGMVLDRASKKCLRMPIFQPVMNGAGGNLAAVQASRMATHLHSQSRPGDLKEDDDTCRGFLPTAVFFGTSKHAKTARVLMLLVVPGHLVFLWAICFTKGFEISSFGTGFFGLYLLGALAQEWFLLYSCMHLVHFQWRVGVDPDNAAVPFLTAMGDLCGSTMLAGAFAFATPLQPSTPPPHPGHAAAFVVGGIGHSLPGPRPALAPSTSWAPAPQLPATAAAAFAALRALRSPLRGGARRPSFRS